MRRLAFLVILFLLISTQAFAEYVTKQNFIHGTIGADYIQTADTVGNTFTIVYGTNSNTMTGCTDANPCRIVVYDASCSQPSSCANREVIDIRTVSSLTFTIDARNVETPNCTSCTFAQGATWQAATTSGILSGLPLPTPTTGCVLQSTDGVNYTCPETLNIETINDTVDFVDNVDNTKVVNIQLSGITTSTTRTWTAQDKDCTVMCTADTSFGGNSATATALAADPANCSAGQIALGVNASGTAECTATPSGLTSVGATTFTGALTGNASTATALAANGTNCSAGEAALGVNASGNAEGCYTPAGGGDVTGVGDCVGGECLDGTSDGGTTISLYDGDSHKLIIDSADLSGDVTLLLGATYTNAKWCSYATATGLNCNETVPGVVAGQVWTGVHDFGGATSIEIVNAAAPTVDAAGEIALDTTDDQIKYYGAAERVLTYKNRRCFTVESPAAADDGVPIFSLDDAFTVTKMRCWTVGGTSVEIILTDGTNALDTMTCDTDGANDDGTIANSTFTADEQMVYNTGTVSGTVTWVNFCFTYTITAE